MSDMFFRDRILEDTLPFCGMGHVSVKYFWARRPDRRLVEGVGAGGGYPGSSAGEGRSLLVEHHVDVEMTQGGPARHRPHEDCRDGKSGEVLRRCDPHDNPPPESPVRRV
jgi:hypothetical protein